MLYNVARKRRAFVDVSFSVIVALEDDANTTAIMNENDSELLLLPKGNFAIWRGDYEHAGASYNQVNRRLFIAIIHRSKDSKFNFVNFNVQQILYII